MSSSGVKRRVERSSVLRHAVANVKQFPHGSADDHHLFFSLLGLEAAFPGLIWQRCQAHFRRNVIDQTPTGLRDRMHKLLDRILTAPSPERSREAFGEACAELKGQADKVLEVLESGWEEATAILALPAKYRRRLRTTNMLERFIEEIRRREKVVRIFPSGDTAYRLIGVLCAERHEEWPDHGHALRVESVP